MQKTNEGEDWRMEKKDQLIADSESKMNPTVESFSEFISKLCSISDICWKILKKESQ